MSRCYLGLGLAGSVHGLERVADKALRAADRARHVEAPVEAAEILRSLEGLLERRLREPKRGPEPLELSGVDVRHAGMMRSSHLGELEYVKGHRGFRCTATR